MTKVVNIGSVAIGGGKKVAIQSMTNTDTRDADKTITQILELELAGADIVRFSVYDMGCVRSIKKIKENTHVPLVADIHFDYKLAVACAENGIDKLRINPGNIGSQDKVCIVANAAKAYGIPIRIGVNSGSVESDLIKTYGSPTPVALVESALRHVKMLEDAHFFDIVISVKASNVKDTVEACRLLAKSVDYPLHIGVTEAGLDEAGLVKSAIGIGALLIDGIGDTVRVSLTGDPTKEVFAAQHILEALDLRSDFVEIVSCPTCGRTTGDLEEVVRMLKCQIGNVHVKRKIKIAVMGCVVNGPGEAKEADIGIAFAPKGAMVFGCGELKYSGEREDVLNRFVADCKELII